jgi:glycerophosphoryl diester phosphodiesterase
MPAPGTTLVIAHRGSTRNAHENTTRAFEAAVRLGADLIECDLRRTGDGYYVIHHDPSAGSKVIGNSAWSEVQAEADARGYQIPTVDELLDVVSSGHAGLDLELKEQGYEIDAVKHLLGRISPERFVVTSFSPGSISAVKTSFPEVRCGILLPDLPSTRRGSAARARSTLLASIDKLTVDFIAPHWKLLRRKILPGTAENRPPLWVWTVNQSTVLQACLSMEGVEAVITDKLELALALRGRESSRRMG